MKSVHKNVIDKINKEIGSNISNLHKSRHLIDDFNKSFNDIETKVRLRYSIFFFIK